MNFLGVGPLELFFVLVLGLIVLGPERLQEMGRAMGRLVAKFLAWQQQSPEAQLVQKMRNDFQQEVAELRTEIVNARRQLDVSAEMRKLRQDTNELLSSRGAAPTTPTESQPSPDTTATTDSEPAATEASDAPQTAPEIPDIEQSSSDAQAPLDADEPGTVPRRTSRFSSNGREDYDVRTRNKNRRKEAGASAATPDAAQPFAEAPTDTISTPADPAAALLLARHDALAHQIETLSADLQALQEQLRARGVLDPEWQASPPQNQHETVSS